MKIFVGFGYHQRDEWIKELVFPLINSFDGDVISGEEIFGAVLSDGVKDKIKECDVLFAMFTPRDEKANGRFTTHDWVRDEYLHAINSNKKVVAFIESKVDWNQGMAGDRQYVPFAEDKKEKLLVDMANILSQWSKIYVSKRLRFLAPPEFIGEIRPLISRGEVKCTYRYLVGPNESPETEASLIKIAGGICIDLKNPPPVNGMVQVKVVANGINWSSDYESLEFLSINLSKE
jgi:hypothetical protein